MSSSTARPGEQRVHQDYIARIRFSNALPPPPILPKLLEIPNTGLASGQYTTPGFASRLAREQPLNVEADAELGMPLNLVGMPGVFDGDERSIQAPAKPPPVHAHDRPLLRSLAALGKPKVAEANVSFLRRTEYIASNSMLKRPEMAKGNAVLARAQRPKRPTAEAPDDSPQAIKRKIDHGFDVAAQDLKDTKRVRHPSKKHLKLVEAVPLLPDLEAFPDSGAYVTIKFLTNPVSSSHEYDSRLLSGLLRPLQRTPDEEALYEAAVEAHDRDPLNNPKPPNLMNYDFYMPQTVAVADRFRRKFDVEDAEHDSDDLYTHGSGAGGYFQFNRVRTYETAQETELDHMTKYDEEIILAYNDNDSYPKQKAFYYYPVMQRSAIRPQRTKNIARTNGFSQDGDEQIIDQLDITVKEPNEEMRDAVKSHKEHPLGWDQAGDEQQPEAEPHADAEAQADADADADVDANADADADVDADADADADVDGVEESRGHGSDGGKSHGKSPEEEDRDAEGEDDDE